MTDHGKVPYPADKYPWATNEQLRANDEYRVAQLSPEERADRERQLMELCRELKEACDRAHATQRLGKRTHNQLGTQD
jgi:hypothetical protein